MPPTGAGGSSTALAAQRSDRGGRRWPTVGLIVAVGSVLLLRLFVVEPVEVASSSMAPTLRAGDHVLTESASLRLGAVRRGDLVTFAAAGSDELTLKRVAALGGDRVAIHDGRLVVNRRSVPEPYADHRRMDSIYFGPVDVPAGSVFVLGDNRDDSRDSRDIGPVPVRDLVGRVVLTW